MIEWELKGWKSTLPTAPPAVSANWSKMEWSQFYAQSKQLQKTMPNTFGVLFHRGLKHTQKVIKNRQLSRKSASTLGVVTNRLRASIQFRVISVTRDKIRGVIGTDVWYGKLYEEGLKKGKKVWPKKEWMKKGIALQENTVYWDKIFRKAGPKIFSFQKVETLYPGV